MTTRTEKVYVLFGSQTGNSEEAAITFAEELPQKLSPQALQKMTGTKDTITLEPKHMQLDDFLEINKADWTRLVIIFVSSYGVGQAPLGCYRFRDLCDAWKEAKETNVLQGVHFGLCGLGDSSYTTFFQNPTVLNEALQQVGATRMGPLGKADAKQTGDNSQAHVIQRWKESIWQPLAEAAVQDPLPDAALKEMQDTTIALCCKINPDFEPPAGSKHQKSKGLGVVSRDNSAADMYLYLTAVPVIMVVMAVIAFYFLK